MRQVYSIKGDPAERFQWKDIIKPEYVNIFQNE